jgi:hypothetical protein
MSASERKVDLAASEAETRKPEARPSPDERPARV